MIKGKADYKEYLKLDKIALHRNRKKPRFNDIVWKYEILLRKCEYYKNCKKGLLNLLILKYYKYRKYKIELKTNFAIPLNSCGKGLSIAHIGPIIINSKAKLGDFCRIHVEVNIGTNAGTTDEVPQLGNYIYIGPGAKIFGNIKIADNIAIGANAVVNKDFLESGITIAGIPAKKISNKGAKALL